MTINELKKQKNSKGAKMLEKIKELRVKAECAKALLSLADDESEKRHFSKLLDKYKTELLKMLGEPQPKPSRKETKSRGTEKSHKEKSRGRRTVYKAVRGLVFGKDNRIQLYHAFGTVSDGATGTGNKNPGIAGSLKLHGTDGKRCRKVGRTD